MYTFKVENQNHEILDFTNNKNYDILRIDGLNPPTAQLNFSTLVNQDGSVYNSGQIQNRNIVLEIKIHGDIETNRIELYKYFSPKNIIRCYYTNKHRNVYIDGYVETFENDFFTINEVCQISIICPFPFWLDTNTEILQFSKEQNLFEFPFDIDENGIEFSKMESVTTQYINSGVESGITIEFTCNGTVYRPKFINVTTNKYIQLDITLNQGEKIKINTKKGEKSIKLIDMLGIERNIINKMSTGSTWLTLVTGLNELSFTAEQGEENLYTSVTFIQAFEGV